jgi:hypothetical protein
VSLLEGMCVFPEAERALDLLVHEPPSRSPFDDLGAPANREPVHGEHDPAQVSRFAGHSKVSTTLDLYVGEWEKRRANDSGTRLAAIYAGVTGQPLAEAESGA